MGELLYKVGDYLLSSSIKTAFAGAGVGLVSYKGMDLIVTSLFDRAIAYIENGSVIALQLMSLAGIDTCISITLSAILARIAILQAKTVLGKI